MRPIKQFQVRGIAGNVSRISIGDRIIDYWVPQDGTESLLIAHDGQNVFDGRTSSHRGKTWEIGQSVNRLARARGLKPPAVIAIWNGNSKADPWTRVKELAPENAFRGGIKVIKSDLIPVTSDQLYGNKYLADIFLTYIPMLNELIGINPSPEKTAMIGSSMGGLCTLNAIAMHGDRFHTALALSTHWVLGGDPLVDSLIENIPQPGNHNIYMSRGTKGLDSQYQPFQERADNLMLAKGYRINQDFMSKVHARTGHNEKSWASYIDEPIGFWLKSIS